MYYIAKQKLVNFLNNMKNVFNLFYELSDLVIHVEQLNRVKFVVFIALTLKSFKKQRIAIV